MDVSIQRGGGGGGWGAQHMILQQSPEILREIEKTWVRVGGGRSSPDANMSPKS